MSTKLERSVVLSDGMYRQIWKIAEKEHSNIPFVTRQLLAKALADLKSKPDWFYEMQEQIVALRNEVMVAQREKGKSEELLLSELKSLVADLRKEAVAVAETPKLDPELEQGSAAFQAYMRKRYSHVPYQDNFESLTVAIEAKKAERAEKGKILRPFFGRLKVMFGGAR